MRCDVSKEVMKRQPAVDPMCMFHSAHHEYQKESYFVLNVTVRLQVLPSVAGIGCYSYWKGAYITSSPPPE